MFVSFTLVLPVPAYFRYSTSYAELVSKEAPRGDDDEVQRDRELTSAMPEFAATPAVPISRIYVKRKKCDEYLQ